MVVTYTHKTPREDCPIRKVMIGAWEGKLAAALILPGALLFNVHHDGEGEKGWLVGRVDDMSPYFKSRITNALALRLMNADWTAVDMFRPPILVITSKQIILFCYSKK